MNSERIFKRYGSYGVDVRFQGANLRISELYSGASSARRTRTVAIVEFIGGAEIPALDAQIRAGRSIGATLTAAGWRVRKTTRWLGALPAHPNTSRVRHTLCTPLPAPVAAHQYLLSATQAGRSVDYALITEIHDGDYLTLADISPALAASVTDETPIRSALDQLGDVEFFGETRQQPCA
ncbi:MAG: hypothetical protein AAFX44_13090 [Pseudomonadota bacterium]